MKNIAAKSKHTAQSPRFMYNPRRSFGIQVDATANRRNSRNAACVLPPVSAPWPRHSMTAEWPSSMVGARSGRISNTSGTEQIARININLKSSM